MKTRLSKNEQLAALIWDPSKGPPVPGVTLLQMLDQNLWWRPKEEPPVRLSAMAPSHRRNLLSWLERQATRIKMNAELRMVISGAGPLGPSGDMACDAFNREVDHLYEMSDQDWLNSQPLVVRLRRMVAYDERRHRRGLLDLLLRDKT